jgi:hypothetical protein
MQHRTRNILFICSGLYERGKKQRLLMREVARNWYKPVGSADRTSKLKRGFPFVRKHTPARRKKRAS